MLDMYVVATACGERLCVLYTHNYVSVMVQCEVPSFLEREGVALDVAESRKVSDLLCSVKKPH